ncbi:polyprenyl synthetase family protein [Pseudoclavibacter helvolus]|uniref:polyprenyl synthetase family protein n=1 Tax=Pseudoclavibacter helvolus TaxID=255205 RepID=UPI003C76615B
MSESSSLSSKVQRRLDATIAENLRVLGPIGVDVPAFLEQAAAFTTGGKRLRAAFCSAGFSSAEGTAEPSDVVVLAAASIELFHAAALVHDDIIDRSDTRRGAPSTHRAFASHHRDSGWAGDDAHFGLSAAILLGDLLLVWSDQLFVEACALVAPENAVRARAEFSKMRGEVTVGQYLDLVEEVAWPVVPIEDRASRAKTIAISKSARYSVEEPLVLGALLGGASDDLVAQIRAFGLPLGLAFQLRDDVLGVFGDEAVTGKPSGDDLREGKRTLMIAAAQELASPEDSARLDELLGDQSVTHADIQWMQTLITESGGLQRTEDLISSSLDEALSGLRELELDSASRSLLEQLAERTAHRKH